MDFDIEKYKNSSYLKRELSPSPDYDTLAQSVAAIDQEEIKDIFIFYVKRYTENVGISFGLRGLYAEFIVAIYRNHEDYFEKLGFKTLNQAIDALIPEFIKGSGNDYYLAVESEIYEMFINELKIEQNSKFRDYLSLGMLECVCRWVKQDEEDEIDW